MKDSGQNFRDAAEFASASGRLSCMYGSWTHGGKVDLANIFFSVLEILTNQRSVGSHLRRRYCTISNAENGIFLMSKDQEMPFFLSNGKSAIFHQLNVHLL